MAAQQIPLSTPETYLAHERTAVGKSEYIAGTILAMAGGSPRHNLVSGNIFAALDTALPDSGACVPFNSDQKVRVREAGPFFYPDASVACTPEFDDSDCLRNPLVIVEVLSPSTREYDRGEKWLHYRRLESLREYVLIHTEQPLVEHYSRIEGEVWRVVSLEGQSATLHLPALSLAIPLTALYRRIAFDDETASIP